nr:helix-turn-helix domain-containing protein [Spelaeicoccus albus]
MAEWQRVVSEQLMPLAIDTTSNPEFEGSVVTRRFGGVGLAVVRTGAHVAERTRRLAAAGDPHYWLGLQIVGVSTVEQAGNRSELRPGDFALYDSSMPYRREFPGDSETFVAIIPQQLIALPPRALALISALGIGPESGMGAIVSPFLTAVARNLSHLTSAQGISTVHAMIELVTSTFAEKFGVVAPHPSARHLDQVMTIRHWIMTRLADPDLNPERIAAAHFVSTRQLHVLFQEQGTTVGTWIRERRLDMARRDLEAPGESSSIRTIAHRWGFADPAYFARAFRSAYGVTPRAYRHHGASGSTAPGEK